MPLLTVFRLCQTYLKRTDRMFFINIWNIAAGKRSLKRNKPIKLAKHAVRL
jgi:hypothetical protein